VCGVGEVVGGSEGGGGVILLWGRWLGSVRRVCFRVGVQVWIVSSRL